MSDIERNAIDGDVRLYIDSFNIRWPVPTACAACMYFSYFESHVPTYCAPLSAWLGGLQVGKPSKSKHNVLPRGNLQFKSLTKEDHGEWECVATNVATSITASTHVQVIGTQHVHKHTYTVRIETWINTFNISDGFFSSVVFECWLSPTL